MATASQSHGNETPPASASDQGLSGTTQNRPHVTKVARVAALCNKVPQELRDAPQWVAYRKEPAPTPEDPNHTTKVPYIASAGGALRKASTTNSKTWRTFDQAIFAFQGRGDLDGLGFVFTKDLGLAGVDLDHMVDAQTGELTHDAQAIVATFDSYAEYSQSHEGAHIIVRAAMAGKGRKAGNYEAYDTGRFFAMTGDQVDGTRPTIEARQPELDGFVARYLPAKTPATPKPSSDRPAAPAPTLDDRKVLELAAAAKNSAKFTELWNGGQAGLPSDSEADLALCCMLRFWVGDDAVRIDHLYRMSGRYTRNEERAAKWDRTDYPAATIAKAIALGGDTYDPAHSRVVSMKGKGKRGQAGAADAGEGGAGGDAGDETTQADADGPIAVTKMVADAIMAAGEVFAVDKAGNLWVYRHGAYVAEGDKVVKRYVKELLTGDLALPHKWTTRQAEEVVAFIAVDAPTLWEMPPSDQVNVQNGILDLATATLRPHTPKFLSPVQLPITYDPAATCPHVDAFIAQVFPADTQALAWEVFAWLMTPDISFQKAIIALGAGGNGKSRWLMLLQNFLGRRHVSAVALQKLEADRFSVARLVGKMANIVADLPPTPMEGTSTFKALVGGDTMLGEQKYKTSFEFTPFARLLFSANTPPRSPDASEAFYDRWVAIPFVGRFRGEAGEVSSTDLDARLASPGELSGVLNKALAVWPALQRSHRFTESPSTKRAMADFRAITDPFTIWLDDNTVSHPDAIVAQGALYVAYMKHCAKNDQPRITKQAFGIALKKARPGTEEKQRTVGGVARTWCYVGIGLRLPEPDGDHDGHGPRNASNSSNALSPIVSSSISYQSQAPEDEETGEGARGEIGESGDIETNNSEKRVTRVTPVTSQARDGFVADRGAMAAMAVNSCNHPAQAIRTLVTGKVICGHCGQKWDEDAFDGKGGAA